MTIERSHNKARPTLVRSSDLRTVNAASNPRDGRTAGGHFAAGNRVGLGARWKAAIKKSLGRVESNEVAELVYRDAMKVYLATLRAMPCDAAPVRSLAALHGRHMAVHAYFAHLAAKAGLDTKDGLALQEAADRQSQRAERVLVSCIDVATKLAPKGKAATTVTEMRARVARAVETARSEDTPPDGAA